MVLENLRILLVRGIIVFEDFIVVDLILFVKNKLVNGVLYVLIWIF